MQDDDSPKKIKSIYEQKHKPKLLLCFNNKNKSEKKYSKYTINKNIYSEIIKKDKFKSISTVRPKSSLSINSTIKSNKEINLNNEENKNSNINNKNTISQELFINKYKNIFSSNIEFQEDFVKKNNIIYLSRKLYIILPNNRNKMYTKLFPINLFFNFYFPIRIINSKIKSNYIKNSSRSDILCDDLDHILFEVFKYLKLSIYDKVKIEIYDDNFHHIIKDSKLFNNKKRIIYAKLTYLDENENIIWKKRTESKLFPFDQNYLIKQFNKLKNNKIPYLYRDASTEYNKNDTRNKIRFRNKTVDNIIIKDLNLNGHKNNNNINSENKNLYDIAYNKTNYITNNNESKKEEDKLNFDYYNDIYEQLIIDNLLVYGKETNFLKLKKNNKTFNYSGKNILEKDNTKNESTQGNLKSLYTSNDNDKKTNIENKYDSVISNTISTNNNYNQIKSERILKENTINDIKNINNSKNRNVLFNFIKKNRIGPLKNNLISPILFDFDVSDIINNEYIFKYLSNKNKDKFESNMFNIKCHRFKIKNIAGDDSNSHRRKSLKIIKNQKRTSKERQFIKKSILKNKNENNIDISDENINFENKDENDEMIKLKMEENIELFSNIVFKIKDFIKREVNSFFTNEETDDFESLKCNYILINELRNFPIFKLKKEFLLFSCLSQKLMARYENLILKINSILVNKKEDNKNLFILKEIDNLFNYLDFLFTNIKNNKNKFFLYIGASNNDLKISYLFLILFIIYNKNLIKNNADKQLIYLCLECAEIPINSDINFQQYCNYKLLMTKNKYINYHKKFNFIKDLMLRVLLNEKFKLQNMIDKLKTIFDVNLDDIKNIFNNDMCSVKLKKNIDIYNKVEDIYEKLINYYS